LKYGFFFANGKGSLKYGFPFFHFVRKWPTVIEISLFGPSKSTKKMTSGALAASEWLKKRKNEKKEFQFRKCQFRF